MFDNLFQDVSYLNLISLVGLFVMVGLAWLMSSHRGKVNWRMVGTGMLLQFLVALVLFNSQTWTFEGKFENGILFFGMDSFFNYLTEWTKEGANFVFASRGEENPFYLIGTFAFGVMPTVIFFAALMSVLYHIGIMEPLVRGVAWIMRKTLGTSGSESLAAAANIFVGHTEAPLVVKPYIPNMTRSELNAMMVGGFATITGSLMAVFVGMGVSAGHIVAASIISAPAALIIAKIMLPETEESETMGVVTTKFEKTAGNVIEAAANGASEGMKLAINICAMLIAFLALIAVMNTILHGVGEFVQGAINSNREIPVDIDWSLSGLFGLLFWPLAWIMGIETGDCRVSGDLLGTKMVINEFIAYDKLGNIVNPPDDAKEVVELSERSRIILTYALCGFSNFGAIGIQLGGIGPLAPKRKSDLAQLGLRAMLGGMLACCMTACIAGILYGVLS